MKNIVHSIALATTLWLCPMSNASANTVRFYSGNSCQGNTEYDNRHLGRWKEGCTNYSAPLTSYPECGAPTLAVLPITGNNSDTVDYEFVSVRYEDANATKAITCQIVVRDSNGNWYASTVLSSGPGVGTMFWQSGNLPNGGNPISGVETQDIYCSIPSRWTSFGGAGCFSGSYSFLRNYRVDIAGQ